MLRIIKGSKDFWAGIIYIAFGLTGAIVGRDYSVGTTNQMGPGYFPLALSMLLMGVGLICLFRTFTVKAPPLPAFRLKPALLIIGALLLCGYLLPRAGLIFALTALMLIAASASDQFSSQWKKIILLIIGTTVFCVIVFVHLLGLSLPLFGTWFS